MTDALKLKASLSNALLQYDYEKAMKLCSDSEAFEYNRIKRNDIKRLEKMMEKKVSRTPGVEQKKWVVNLSGIELTTEQKSVLELGLNYAVAPSKFPVIDTVTAIEDVARKLRTEDANDLRGRVCGIMRNSKLPKDNITREQ